MAGHDRCVMKADCQADVERARARALYAEAEAARLRAAAESLSGDLAPVLFSAPHGAEDTKVGARTPRRGCLRIVARLRPPGADEFGAEQKRGLEALEGGGSAWSYRF